MFMHLHLPESGPEQVRTGPLSALSALTLLEATKYSTTVLRQQIEAGWTELANYDLEPLPVLEQRKLQESVQPSQVPVSVKVSRLLHRPGGPPVTNAPNSPTVALPEMDLTVSRDEWPAIIRATTGHMLAYGWPGTGKSYDFSIYAEEVARTKNEQRNAEAIKQAVKTSALALEMVEHEEVNCTRQTSAAAWLGHWIDSGKTGFQWNDGPVARAMKAGVPIVINDVHLCSDDLFDLLFFVLDTRPGAKYSLPNGTHLRAEPGFRALLSMNGDPIQVLDEPIRDRIAVPFEINVPSKGQLRQLDSDVRPICRVLYQNAKIQSPRFTFRTFQAFCQLRRQLGDAFKAARLACGTEERARGFLEPLLVAASTTSEAPTHTTSVS